MKKYYDFGKALSLRFNHYKNESYGDMASRALVNDEVRERLPRTLTKEALRKRTEKARKIYSLFSSLEKGEDKGREKIDWIRTFSASAIARLTLDDIEYVVAKILKASQQ